MRRNWRRLLRTLLSVGIATVFLFAVSSGAFGQDGNGDAPPPDDTTAVDDAAAVGMASMSDIEAVQTNLDLTWVLVAGFLVFFMQAGFAMLEGGFIRHTGVVNSMAENFMDACVTGVMFFIIGYGIAFGSTANSLVIPGVKLALGGINGTGEGDGATFVMFFFQFAFAGAAATIATGAMAERTDFRAKIVYSTIIALIVYPMVVFWTWGGGFLADLGFMDFAGSTVVHMTGGIIALAGAAFVGPRINRVWGSPPKPHNLFIATLGTFILWFGWYGFNVGSTLAASDVNIMGLVAVNTTLAACIGALSAMAFVYLRTGKWDLPFILNGSLAGLVAITAGCAFVSPLGALAIGLAAGVLVVLSVEFIESLKIDDAVGAFSVHGACGAMGTLAIGLLAVPELTGTDGGLLMGGGVNLFINQLIGVAAVALWVSVTSVAMFAAIRAMGILRIPEAGDELGIDAYEHGASVWPDVLPIPEHGTAAIGD